ncbi:MAG: hypothetical protein ACXABY_06275 [Candidatus Thorarchaeota archaeon]|jgi:hypothetical protein
MNKHSILTRYAETYGTKVFVETGTYKGNMVKAMLKSKLFDQIHTVDIFHDRVVAARKKFSSFTKVKCWSGDSATVLPAILDEIHQPALFWLDAHHSGGRIARTKGLIETPVLDELTNILKHPYDHIILIDDANYYRKYGEKIPEYPTTKDLKNLVKKFRPEWTFKEIEDIIRIHRHGFDCKTIREKGPLC